MENKKLEEAYKIVFEDMKKKFAIILFWEI